MTQVAHLKAEKRTGIGRGQSRATRRSGLVPGVVYGGNKEPQAIQLAKNHLEKALHSGGFFTKLYDLEIDGSKERVLARDIQLNVINDIPEHIDFMRVSAKTKIRLDIPVHLTHQDKCPGLKAGGLLNLVRHSIEVLCFAENIPAHIDISVEGKDIGDSIHINDITLPQGVKAAVQNQNFTIVQIAEAKMAEIEEPVAAAPAEGAEGAAPAEGAEGEAAAAGDAKTAAPAAGKESGKDKDATKGKGKDKD